MRSEVKARFKELESAEAVFITNSVRGIIPVVQILQQEYKAEHELVKALVEKLKEEINNYINAPERVRHHHHGLVMSNSLGELENVCGLNPLVGKSHLQILMV